MGVAKIKELQDKRLELNEQIKSHAKLAEDRAAANEEWTAEDESSWESMNADYNGVCDELSAENKSLQRLATMQDRTAEIESSADKYKFAGRDGAELKEVDSAPKVEKGAALTAWAKFGLGLNDSDREAAKAAGVDVTNKNFDFPLDKLSGPYAAQSVGTNTAGGFLDPSGFVPSLERALLAFGGMFNVANVIRTERGNTLDWPTMNDTGNTGAILAENTQDGFQDVTFGNVQLGAYKYTSKIILVSHELLQDSLIDVPSLLGEAVGERLGRIANTHFTTGTGTAQPSGIVTGATSDITAAAVAAVTVDELLSLKHSVDPAYRTNASWMFNDSTLLAIKKLKDGNGQYLWSAGLASNEPDRLDGDKIQINQDVASMATAAKAILYGALGKYIVREVGGVRLVRMTERYADFDQEAFVAFMRWDGILLDAGTAPVKYITMA